MPVRDPDQPLIDRAQRGDREAYALLLDRHLDRMQALAERLLGSRADAEDVVQEAFIRLWQQIPRWRAGQAKIGTWLYQVVLNRCRDQLRRRTGVSLDAIADVPCQRPTPESVATRTAVGERVNRALAELPERQREAVVLSHYETLSNPEIGQLLGVSVEAVESLLARGRRRLRTLLGMEREDLMEDET